MRRIATARGVYLLRLASKLEPAGDAIGLTITLERADGIEKVALRCLIPPARLSEDERADPAKTEPRLEEWLVSGFEQIREAALKSIRNERRLWEARFLDSPGPWRTARA
jgi:hypothetical protein